MPMLHANCVGYEEIELVSGKLHFVIVDQGSPLPYSDFSHLYFSTDESFIYTPLKEDNGPLNLGLLYKYCKLLQEKVQDPANKDKKLYHATNGDDVTRTNAAVLIGAFMIMVLNKTADETYAPFRTLKHAFARFHDCWKSPNTPGITLIDCYRGLYRAVTHRFFDFETFNVAEYDLRQEVANGDINWIIPGKLVAFKGPRTTPKNQPSYPPSFYLTYLQSKNVKSIVRLNKNHYDKVVFTESGMAHYDLYFGDGTIPTTDIVEEFLKIVEKQTVGAIAVHCKGGIGRTGTLICASLIRHYNFKANEAIAWVRICRPGSVMGKQQIFLQIYAGERETNDLPQDTGAPKTVVASTEAAAGTNGQ